MHYCKKPLILFPGLPSLSAIAKVVLYHHPHQRQRVVAVPNNEHDYRIQPPFHISYITKRKYNLYPLQTNFNAKIDFHPDLKRLPRFFARDPKTAKPEFSVKLMVITSCPSFLIPLLAPRAVNQPIREGHLAFRPIRSQETGNDPIEPRALPASGKLRWK